MTEAVVHAPVRERTGLRWWTAALTSAALLVVTLNNLVVTTALPALQRDLNASFQGFEWSANAYILGFAVFLLFGARLGDRFGRRRMFVAGLVVFTAASAACALAPNIERLDAARAVQGAGGALVAAVSLTILGDALRGERRAVALGLWWGIGAIALVLGPLLGGAVVHRTDWRWIFWLDVPVGIAALVPALANLRETRSPDARLDLPAVTMSAGGLFGIVWGLTRGPVAGWTSHQVLVALAAGSILFAAFVVWELGAASPLLPVRSFRDRAVAAAHAISLLTSFALFGSLFLLVLFLELVRDESPLRAGLATVPPFAAILLVGPLAGALSTRVGARVVAAVGLLVQTAALGWLAYTVDADLSYRRLLAGLALFGAGIGLSLPPTASAILSRPGDPVAASWANSAIRAVGGVLGIAGLTAILLSSGSLASADAYTHGLVRALWAATGVAAAAAVVSLVMPRRGHGVREVTAVAVGARPTTTHAIWAAEAAAGERLPELHRAHMPSGHGTTGETETFPCPVCLGDGRLTFVPAQDPYTQTCPRCYGHGAVLTGSHVPNHVVRDCPECDALGYVAIEALPEPPQIRRVTAPPEQATLPRADGSFDDAGAT